MKVLEQWRAGTKSTVNLDRAFTLDSNSLTAGDVPLPISRLSAQFGPLFRMEAAHPNLHTFGKGGEPQRHRFHQNRTYLAFNDCSPFAKKRYFGGVGFVLRIARDWRLESHHLTRVTIFRTCLPKRGNCH